MLTIAILFASAVLTIAAFVWLLLNVARDGLERQIDAVEQERIRCLNHAVHNRAFVTSSAIASGELHPPKRTSPRKQNHEEML